MVPHGVALSRVLDLQGRPAGYPPTARALWQGSSLRPFHGAAPSPGSDLSLQQGVLAYVVRAVFGRCAR